MANLIFPSGRKAFGAVNKNSTPAVNPPEKQLLQKTKGENEITTKTYPEIEGFFPSDPLAYLKYDVPEDFVDLGKLDLHGLARFPQARRPCEDDFEELEPLPDLSPIKMPERSDYCLELDLFLQAINELTVEFPPEHVYE